MGSLTRRRFVQYGAVGGVTLALPWSAGTARAAAPTGATPSVTKYLEPLFAPPVIDATVPNNALTGAFETSIAAGEGAWSFHRQLAPARTWGYGGAPYLGPTINAKRGVPVHITWQNNLGATFLPNDPQIMGAIMPGTSEAPIAPHLHGGFTPPQFDGTPLQWFTRSGATGPHFAGYTYTYPNEQRATMLWYHDHALGNTRTNVYAGLAALYFIRDEVDTGTPDNPLGLPAGPYEIPLVLQDKTFNADGSLFYPSVGLPPHTVWVPEFFGDTPVVNGKCYPFLNVEPRRYRFRIVNGSQARFYNLKLASLNGNFQLPFTVIGTEGGLLRAPVATTALLIAPGERYDVIVDFAGSPKNAGGWILKNDAKAPYPMGAGGAVAAMMQFNVALPLSGVDTTTPAASLALPAIPALPATGVTTRQQHLKEILDPATGNPVMLQVEDQPYLDTTGQPGVTTKPKVGSVEDWLLINTTADTHPIHLHLVNFEVIDRQPFNAATYLAGGGLVFTGAAAPRLPIENGLKDTVKAHPGEVTRIRARFDLPPGAVTPAQYVWHCHILEHEENDMMRAFEVVA